jgi:N,N'-diacetylchitobiose phosphorylase
MRYGHFDNTNREYVIERPDVPVSWTNYIGVENLCTVISHNAGGYSFYKHAEHQRVTRFRPNGVPLDRPGHYVYLRDDDTGEYWSISWQPVGKDLAQAKYECRHGLSYSKFSCDYRDLHAEQTIFIPIGDDVELWDVRIRNNGATPRGLSVFSYLEFSFHHIEIDNQNLQMSLYASGSSCEDGVIEYDFFYEPWTFHYFAASFQPDSFDSMRDSFIGPYRSETNPIAVERGKCGNSVELGGNHCGALHKRVTIAPGEEARLVFMLGVGPRAKGREIRAKYSDLAAVDRAFDALGRYWHDKLAVFQCETPHAGLDTMINTWTLYQTETCVVWSRFASFIEVGGRTGLGYRDTSQDVMSVVHTNPAKCRQRIIELLQGQVSQGYGLHLFDPDWFDPEKQNAPKFKSPTVTPTPDRKSLIHGLADVCSDDALWLVPSVCEYVKETGDVALFDQAVPFADEGTASVYEHLKRALDFSAEQVGPTGICKGLRADLIPASLGATSVCGSSGIPGAERRRAEVLPAGGKGARRLREGTVGRRVVHPRHHRQRRQDRHAGERGRQDFHREQHLGRGVGRRVAGARPLGDGRGRPASLLAVRHSPALAGILEAQRRYRVRGARIQRHQGERRDFQPP